MHTHKTNPKKELKRKYQHTNLIGTSKAIRKVFDLIDKVAGTDGTVLITGPSGTGKELIARAIHEQSDRGDEAFVTINCGSIPENLLESEFFGHRKGAFTGAVKKKRGKFELANQGTLLLDEIGDMQENIQTKIRRMVDEFSRFARAGDVVLELGPRAVLTSMAAAVWRWRRRARRA